MPYFIHFANVLYLASYLVKDILWLRVLTVFAGMALVPYFTMRAQPLWEAVAWNAVFVVINLHQIYLLLLERRPVILNDDEQRIYQLAFRSLSPREFLKLLSLSRWERLDSAALLARRGQELDRIMVIASGRAGVRSGERVVAELRPGQFVGEMSFLTGELPNVDVVALEPVLVVGWPKQPLREFLKAHAPLRAALQMVIGADLAAKLRTA